MVYYILDCETDEWNIKKAIHTKNNYNYQILNIKIIGLIKFDKENLIEQKIFHSNQLNLLANYLLDEYLENKKTALRIYSHNLDFDIKFLINIFLKKGLLVKPIQRSRMLSCKIQMKGNKEKHKSNATLIDFRDSFALLPLSIKKIGKIVGLEKLEINYDDLDKTTPKWIDYCLRDCEITQKGLLALCKLFEKFNYPIEIEELPLTIPSLSIKLFLKENQHYKFKKELSNGCKLQKNALFDISPNLNEYFRKFYFGGRCECFNFNIAEFCDYYDKNSMYPNVMIKHKFPIPPYIPLCTTNQDHISNLTFGIECTVDESNESIPLIPVRFTIIDTSIILFPATQKKCLLFIEEYEYLKKRNVPIKIFKIWNCFSWEFIFNYMQKIYKIRTELKAENNPLNELCKLPLNATYGKFAQNSTQNERMINPLTKINNFDELVEKIRKGTITSIDINNKTYNEEEQSISEKTIQPEFINLIFACRITALSRLDITKEIHSTTDNKVICYYTDTDSIVAQKESSQFMNMGKNLGQMKVEEEFRRFLALSPKEYLFETLDEKISDLEIFTEKSKLKGINQNSNIEDYLIGIQSIRPTKVNETMKRKIPFNSAITMIKQKNTFYYKRIINSDLSTKPLRKLTAEYLDIIEKRNKRIILNQIKKWEQTIISLKPVKKSLNKRKNI